MSGSADRYVPVYAGSARANGVALAVWGVVAAGAALILALIALAPLGRAAGHGLLANALYGGFHVVCHQLPERSFRLGGHPLAVCARCVGLYAGFAAGALVYPLVARPLGRRVAPPRALLLVAAAPLALDFALGFLGVWENTHLSRALTGALLGAVLVFFIVPGLVDFALTYASGRWRAPEVRPSESLTEPISEG